MDETTIEGYREYMKEIYSEIIENGFFDVLVETKVRLLEKELEERPDVFSQEERIELPVAIEMVKRLIDAIRGNNKKIFELLETQKRYMAALQPYWSSILAHERKDIELIMNFFKDEEPTEE